MTAHRKVGYLAPSVDGHSDVVREALAVAGLEPRSITLLEAHGTGTAVGDPIEFQALTAAFDTDAVGYCRLVSTKPNIGHLDTAAGVASFIKVVQALRHRYLPPLANFTAPSPLIQVDRSPFVIAGDGATWESATPRLAGISSLGVGGTNAHVIVEEAPPTPAPSPARTFTPLLLSARSAASLDRQANRLADHLAGHPEVSLADVAFTLRDGRRRFSHRRVIVGRDIDDTVDALRATDRKRTFDVVAPADLRPQVVFLFPGGGSQYAGMGAGLDERFAVFHDTRREGVDHVRNIAAIELLPHFAADADEGALRDPVVSLCAIFITSVALARQWIEFGVEPDAIVGHSLGEYVAAVLADVFTFEDALRLVVARARLMGETSGGGAAMLVVPLPEADVATLAGEGLSLAAVNAVDECVVSGDSASIDAFSDLLAARDVTCSRIPLNAAAHSHLLDPVLGRFERDVRGITLRSPKRRYVSNLTGTWITDAEATDPTYWVRHLRGTVRFESGLRTVFSEGPALTIELGPGHALSSYARRHEVKPVKALAGLRHPNDHVDDTAFSMLALASAAACGIDVPADALLGAGERNRLRLPTYSFDRERYWIEPGAPVDRTVAPGAATSAVATGAAAGPLVPTVEKLASIQDWISVVDWTEDHGLPATTDYNLAGSWSIIADADDPLATAIKESFAGSGIKATVASPDATTRNLVVVGPRPRGGAEALALDRAADRWLHGLLPAVRTIAASGEPARLVLVTRAATDAGPAVATNPSDALAFGVGLIAPKEYSNVSAVVVDISAESDSGLAELAASIVDEASHSAAPLVSRRGDRRFIPARRRATGDLAPSPIVRGGTYIVTGALGGVGFELAHWMASEHRTNLVVAASSPVPPAVERADYLASHAHGHPTARRLRRLAALEATGVRVDVVEADLADPHSVARLVDTASRRLGRIDGVVHAAGRLFDRPIELLTDREDIELVIGAKARGAAALVDALQTHGIPRLVVLGSSSAHLAPVGQVSYVAANALVDALAGQRGSLRVTAIDFGVWTDTGMAFEAFRRQHLGGGDVPLGHPVLTSCRLRRDGTLECFGEVDEHDWVANEHRMIDGTALLPGAAHVELMLAAVRAAGVAVPSLADLTVLAPVVVGPRPVALRVTVDGPDSPTRFVRIESDEGLGREWFGSSEARLVEPPAERADTLVPVSVGEGSSVNSFIERPSRHLRLGPRWQARGRQHGDGAHVTARIDAASLAGAELDHWLAHPALLDVATAIGVAMTPDSPTQLYVPVRYGRVHQYGGLASTTYVDARLRKSDGRMLVSLILADASGNPALVVDDLELQPMATTQLLPSRRTATAASTSTSLLELSDRVGIRPSEGVEAFDQALRTPADHLLISSVDIDSLLALDAAAAAAADAPTAPTDTGSTGTTLATVLTGMWRDLLGVAEIGERDDFFDLGGHSLIAIRLMARVHKELGVRLPLTTLFEAPTIAQLCELIAPGLPDGSPLTVGGPSHAPAPGVVNGVVNPGSGVTNGLASVAPAAQAAPQAAPQGAGGPTQAGEAARPAPNKGEPAPKDQLVQMRPGGTARPFFVIHGAGGNLLNLWGLASPAAVRPSSDRTRGQRC